MLFRSLLLASLGLLFHAWLVHLAAGFVLEEPRYINAVGATLVVWIVGVPIELLGIAPIAALPVALLANYAGLELSYSASRGRTIALLVVSMIVFVLAGLALGLLMAPFKR